MTHADVRERMELAALEPDGLDRLMAGDTPEAVLIAGHLAGCPACLDEMGRLRRTARLIRRALEPGDALPTGAVSRADVDDDLVPTMASSPPLPPALRERTLAFVREFGVPRPLAAAPSTPAQPAVVRSVGGLGAGSGRLRPAAWLASIAAAILVAVVGTAVVLGNGRASDETADLTRLATWSIDVAHAPDARQVALSSPAGGPTVGQLAFVPSSGKLVVSARDLAAAPAGKEYRCWMELAGSRTVVGRMFFANGIAYWVGPVRGLAAIPPGTRFGVTLVDAAGSSIDGDPVLVGSL